MNQLTRRTFLEGTGALAALGLPASALAQSNGKKRNVLFIAVDDLKPLLGCYGDTTVQSPHIDKLAQRGMVFTRAYCQQAVCAPSRNSLLTGKRPETIGIYDLQTNFRTKLPDVVTLPQHFKQNGYHTEGMGKIFHVAHGNFDDARSWSVPSQQQGPIPPKEREHPDAYKNVSLDDGLDDWWEAREFARVCGLSNEQEAQELKAQEPKAQETPASLSQTPQIPTGRNSKTGQQGGPPVVAPDVPDNALQDGKTADRAIERLRVLKDGTRPFFLAVGFLKPHLPFIAPKRYFDLYKREQFTPDPRRELPKNAPAFAGHGPGELAMFDGIPGKGPVTDEQARELLHGYHACVSYMDAQVGRILDEIDRLGLRDNTVVVLWGDHGWHLGDHGQWAKHTNFEQAANAPLIFRVPGQKNAGQKCDALTEFVDIYPSLCEFAGVPLPAGLEGTSVAPLLENPKRPWKSAAFHVWPRRVQNKIVGLGRAIRTERYRLCEWTVDGKPEETRYELYDFVQDPGETVNLANDPKHKATVNELTAKLRAGWQAALPPGNV